MDTQCNFNNFNLQIDSSNLDAQCSDHLNVSSTRRYSLSGTENKMQNPKPVIIDGWGQQVMTLNNWIISAAIEVLKKICDVIEFVFSVSNNISHIL